MTKAASLLDEVLSVAVRSRSGPAPWVDRLPEDLRAELAQVKDAYRKQQIDLGKYAIAKAVKRSVEGRGFHCVNQAGVVRWLDAD